MKRLFIAALSLLFAANSFAAQGPIISISHKQPTLKELPLPGNTMILASELQQTRDVDRPVRLIAVRDGRLLDVPLLRSYLNDHDHPIYEFQLVAPLAEISYQFILSDPTGNTVSTQRFNLRRKCIPPIDLTDPKVDPNTEIGQKITALATNAENLEQEIKQYTGVIATLTELEGLLKE